MSYVSETWLQSVEVNLLISTPTFVNSSFIQPKLMKMGTPENVHKCALSVWNHNSTTSFSLVRQLMALQLQIYRTRSITWDLVFFLASRSAQPHSISFAFIWKSDSSKECQTHNTKLSGFLDQIGAKCYKIKHILPNLPFRGRWQPRPASEWPNSVTRRRRVDRRQNGGGPGFAGFLSGWKDPKEPRFNPLSKSHRRH